MSQFCRKCGKEISGPPCVFCGDKGGRSERRDRPSMRETSQVGKSILIGCLGAPLAFLATCAACVAILDDGEPAGPSESLAYIMCQNFTENRLRAPSTADWVGYNRETADQGDGLYLVVAQVDAENAFGADQVRIVV